jgi:hypothetical protein
MRRKPLVYSSIHVVLLVRTNHCVEVIVDPRSIVRCAVRKRVFTQRRQRRSEDPVRRDDAVRERDSPELVVADARDVERIVNLHGNELPRGIDAGLAEIAPSFQSRGDRPQILKPLIESQPLVADEEERAVATIVEFRYCYRTAERASELVYLKGNRGNPRVLLSNELAFNASLRILY